MTIKCSFSIPLKSIGEFTRLAKYLPPLPDYIVKRGPFIDEKRGGGASQITTVYEFDDSLKGQAWENISAQMDAFREIPGFTLSAKVTDGKRLSPQNPTRVLSGNISPVL